MLFNGTYTVENAETGEHRTFQIKTVQSSPERPNPLAGKRILSLLSGSDNENDYQSFGFVFEASDRLRVAVWKRCLTPAFTAYASLFEKLARVLPDEALPESELLDLPYGSKRYNVRLAKRCSRCNRKLTHPDSLVTGIGPECSEKLGLPYGRDVLNGWDVNRPDNVQARRAEARLK